MYPTKMQTKPTALEESKSFWSYLATAQSYKCDNCQMVFVRKRRTRCPFCKNPDTKLKAD